MKTNRLQTIKSKVTPIPLLLEGGVPKGRGGKSNKVIPII